MKKDTTSEGSGETRRNFIKQAVSVAALASAGTILKTPVYGQTQAPSLGRTIGANDRIRVAYVGTGSQGMASPTANNPLIPSPRDVSKKPFFPSTRPTLRAPMLPLPKVRISNPVFQRTK